ncbi:MAG: class I SAM-dependent methyltransferase [Micromonosporaceae bacterium]
MGLAQKVAPRGTRRREWAEAVVNALRPARRPGDLAQERRYLKRSWKKHNPDNLDEYLVSGYQNPRVNAQSMLVRHQLTRALFGTEFDALMRKELEHCVKATEAIRVRAAERGVKMVSYLDPEKRAAVHEVAQVVAGWEDAYEQRWAKTLADRTAEKIKLLEFACGSANDYRFFDSYGLAPFLDYTGVDLNEANIDNARRRSPGVDFQVGSVLDLPYEDHSYDYVVVSDLFEHLSLEAMEQALAEAARLARKGLILTFFSMADQPEHSVKPVRDYHWNVLSQAKVQELVERDFGPVRVIRIRDMLREEFDYRHSYNKNAWTMLADRAEG